MTDTTTEAQASLVLTFGEGEGQSATFKAHRHGNAFLVSQHLDGLFSGYTYVAAKAATTLVMDQVEDDEKDRLAQFLMDNGRADDYADRIYDGLNATWRGETSFPSSPSPDSSTPTDPTDGEPPSTDASPSAGTQATGGGAGTGRRAARKSTGSTRASRSAASSRPRTSPSASKAKAEKPDSASTSD